MRKGIVIIIVGLFISASIITVCGSIGIKKENVCNDVKTNIFKAESGKIIYVDDDNTDGPWDGTQEYPFNKIQDAIDNASDGDTVFVFSGIYNKGWPRIYKKSIDLIGENKETTTIYGVLGIQRTKYVNVTGFTLRDTVDGILIMNSNDIFIFSNNFIGNYNGISISNVSYSISVYLNSFANNNDGVDIRRSAHDTIIRNNIFENNIAGISIENSYNNNISNNLINDTNLGEGYLFGISVSNGNNNTIFNNTILNTGKNFNPWIEPYSSGIYIHDSKVNLISHNNISKNQGDGILLGISDENKIISNTIIGNNDRGIRFLSSRENEIISNTISKNNIGAFIDEQELYSRNNIFYHNNFINNGINAIDNLDNIWDNGEEGNYWSDYKGKDLDGDGIGETPYKIPGLYYDSQDNYPWINPDGKSKSKIYCFPIFERLIQYFPYFEKILNQII